MKEQNNSPPKKRKKLIIAIGIAAYLAAVLMIVLMFFSPFWLHSPNQTNNSLQAQPSTVDVWDILSLVKSQKESGSIALVEFTSDWVPLDPLAKVWAKQGRMISPVCTVRGEKSMPATRQRPSSINTSVGYDRIYLQGRFRVLQDLRFRFPRWGHVDDSVKVSTGGILGGMPDETCRNLAPLLQTEKPYEPILLVAINAPDSKAPREAKFLGPLKQADLQHVPELMGILNREDYGTMSNSRAAFFVGSPNPWVAWLGLARLNELKALRPEHFALAMHSRAAEDFDSIYSEMAFSSTKEPFLKSLPSIALSDEIDPKMQKKVLQKILSLYAEGAKTGKQEIASFIDLPRFQREVRAYRPRAAADPKRQPLVPYLDRVLRLR